MPKRIAFSLNEVTPRSTRVRTTNIESRQPIRRMLRTCAVAVAAIVSAGAMWFAGAGTALAPEPAKLRASLGSYYATAAAVYVNTGTDTSVIRWYGVAIADARVKAAGTGAPCSTVSLMWGQQTSQVLTFRGSYALCG